MKGGGYKGAYKGGGGWVQRGVKKENQEKLTITKMQTLIQRTFTREESFQKSDLSLSWSKWGGTVLNGYIR